MNNIKNFLAGTFLIFLLTPVLTIASAGTPITLTGFQSSVQEGATSVIAIINQILIVIIFGGLIYVVGTLIASGSPNKNVIAAWISSIVIWGLAQLFLGLDGGGS